ncbi:MAG: polysaccharide biosynthesis/export family protein, partial [Candidatus Acidiferrales bacterium]
MRTNPFRLSLLYSPIFLATAFLLMIASASAQMPSAVVSHSLLSGKNSEVSGPAMGEISGAGATGLAKIQNEESRIGPGDVLDISVFEAPEMNRTLPVLADGNISMELLGAVRASGLTPTELESALRERLKETYMKDPHVSVVVRQLESHPVSVVGAVKKPGVFQIQGTKTVLEMLSMAEGPTDDAGDKVMIMRGAEYAGPADPDRPGLSRPPAAAFLANGKRYELTGLEDPPARSRTGRIEEVNLKQLMESDDSALNLPVYPGDIVKVTSTGIVYVVGEVHKPGGFVLKNNHPVSLLQA